MNVDEPALQGLLPAQDLTTTDTAYVRFHGRNAAAWWGGGAKDSGSTDRYDYGYSESELSEWITRIDAMLTRASGMYLFFNNCVRGQAADSALIMRRLLHIPGPENPHETLF